jgi:hypothetical protein
MATLNYAFKELSCKIVYYGCGLCGKTTNLIHIHKTVPQKFRGELVSLATEQDRTLFFDFLPLDLGEVRGFKTKFQLYTVPGQVYYNATRKLVLRGVDGLVFVADSQRDRLQENLESLENLKQNLAEYGYHLQTGPNDSEGIPWILQYNKRDMPQVSTLEELNNALNPGQVPTIEAVAVNGSGVKDTLKGISSLVIKKLNADATGGPPKEEPKKTAVAAPAGKPAEEYDSMSEEERAELEGDGEPKAKKPIAAPPVTPKAAPAPAATPASKPAPAPTPAPKAAAPAPAAKPAPAPAAAAPKKEAPAANPFPTLSTTKQGSALWRGMGLGSSNLTIANMVGGEKDQYQLTGKISFLGIFGGSVSRQLKHAGSEQKNDGSGTANFHKFLSSDNAGPAMTVYVRTDDESIYASYLGSAGEVQVVPAGKKPLS